MKEYISIDIDFFNKMIESLEYMISDSDCYIKSLGKNSKEKPILKKYNSDAKSIYNKVFILYTSVKREKAE